MPIIPKIGQKTLKGRLVVLFIYAVLTVLGATMVVPFMVTVSSSFANAFDYDRFSPLPRQIWSRSDRFVKGLVYYYNIYSDWHLQSQARFRDMPEHWSTWATAGRDQEGVKALAGPYLDPSPEQFERWKRIAADYAEIADRHPVQDTICALTDAEATPLLMNWYKLRVLRREGGQRTSWWDRDLERRALDLLEETWGMPIENVYAIGFQESELWLPYWQQSFYGLDNPKYAAFEDLKEAFQHGYAQPGVRRSWLRYLQENLDDPRHPQDLFPVTRRMPEEIRELWLSFRKEHAPAARSVPFAMRVVWRKYLVSEEVSALLNLPAGEVFDVETYNRLAGTRYEAMFDTPFPVPEDAPETLRNLWTRFIETRYPVRLTSLIVTPELEQGYQDFLRKRFKTLERATRLLGTDVDAWDRFKLSSTVPVGDGQIAQRNIWFDFVINAPIESRIVTSSEHVYQAFLSDRYGSLEAVNDAYGWALERMEEAVPPFDIAYAVTFLQNERAFAWAAVSKNYSAVAIFLFHRGSAILVTFFLVGLAIVATLTVNPLAAYGLSRFAVRGKDKILLYMLFTMAFPAMVSAIPAYLLMRDLHLLNTFLALVLPFAANGMSIFILKGFFDSLPQELYDAANIDGATELQIFARITMPMMKPILAIQSLGAFIWAYTSWEWALIICQKQSMWTLAVWLFQADSRWWADTPWIATAGYVVISIPTLLVFLFCQRIILRGIIIPSMK